MWNGRSSAGLLALGLALATWPVAAEEAAEVVARVWAIFGLVLLYLSAGAAVLALGVLFLAVFPRLTRTPVRIAQQSPVRCGLLGAAATLFLLVVAGVLGEIPVLNVVVVLGLLLAALLMWLVAGQLLGQRVLFAVSSPKSDLPIWNFATGAGLLWFAAPIGWIVVVPALLIGLGAVAAAPFAKRTQLPAPEKTASDTV